jgi:hypothetical protein
VAGADAAPLAAKIALRQRALYSNPFGKDDNEQLFESLSLHHRLTMTMGYQKRALAVLVAVLCILPLASAGPVSLMRLFVC